MIKLQCHRIYLVAGGYEKGTGIYYGVGQKLFSISTEEGKHITNIRAASRDWAMVQFEREFRYVIHAQRYIWGIGYSKNCGFDTSNFPTSASRTGSEFSSTEIREV